MTNETTIPLFLDFEASSLNLSSYPIQVAWSLPNGHIECWLIKREFGWKDWDEDAQLNIHQISKEMLREHGCPADWILKRMNEHLQDQIVFCDGGQHDAHWLRRLIAAAGFNATFDLQDVQQLFPGEIFLHRKGKGSVFQELSEEAWKSTSGRRHQADTDVRYLQNLWKLVNRL